MLCKLCLVVDTFINSIQLHLECSNYKYTLMWCLNLHHVMGLWLLHCTFQNIFEGISAVCDAYCKFFILSFLTCSHVVLHIHCCFWVWQLLPCECYVYNDKCKIPKLSISVAVVDCRIDWTIKLLRKGQESLFEYKSLKHNLKPPKVNCREHWFKRSLWRSWSLNSPWSVYGRN